MVSETLGSTRSCCNSAAGSSQAAIDSGCAWACWALLPSRGQKRCFGTVREFIGDLVHVILSARLHALFFTKKTAYPQPQKCRVLASRAAVLQLRISPPRCSTRSQLRVRSPREPQGCGRRIRVRAEQKFSGYWTREPGHAEILLGNALPFSQSQTGRVQDARRAAGAGSERTPSGFPTSSQAAKGHRPVFSFFVLPARGAGGHLQTTLPVHPPPPRPLLSLRVLQVQKPKINKAAVMAFSNARYALCALRLVASLIPSLLFLVFL